MRKCGFDKTFVSARPYVLVHATPNSTGCVCWSSHAKIGLNAESMSLFLINLVCLFLAPQPPVGQGLLIHEVSRSHTTTHHGRQDPSGRVISSSQRSLPDNTHYSQQTDIRAPGGIRPTSPASERPQTYAFRPRGCLDRLYI
jgi:hypothetical protein